MTTQKDFDFDLEGNVISIIFTVVSHGRMLYHTACYRTMYNIVKQVYE